MKITVTQKRIRINLMEKAKEEKVTEPEKGEKRKVGTKTIGNKAIIEQR